MIDAKIVAVDEKAHRTESEPAPPNVIYLSNESRMVIVDGSKLEPVWTAFIEHCKHYVLDRIGRTAHERKWARGTFDSYSDPAYRITILVCEGSPTRAWIVLNHQVGIATIWVARKTKEMRFDRFVEIHRRGTEQ